MHRNVTSGFAQGYPPPPTQSAADLPSLPDVADWEAYEAARQHLMPNLSLRSPAPRYSAKR